MTPLSLNKIKIRRGDNVRVLRGKDRGKTARVMAVLPKIQRVVVEGVNLVKKHVRPKRAGEKGQRVAIAAAIPVSNVQLVCPDCKKSTRVGMRRLTDGTFERLCKHCEAVIALPK